MHTVKVKKGEGVPCPMVGLGGGAHLPYVGLEPVGGYTTKSITHGQCVTRPTVTFPASEHHRPLTGAKLYCFVTEVHRCKY